MLCLDNLITNIFARPSNATSGWSAAIQMLSSLRLGFRLTCSQLSPLPGEFHQKYWGLRGEGWGLVFKLTSEMSVVPSPS